MNVLKEIRDVFGDALALLHGNFLVVTSGFSLFMASFMVFYPYQGKYIEALGGSFLAIGAVYGFWELISATAGIAGGYLCDTYGRRRTMVIGNYATAAMWFIVALAPTWESYFAARCLLAIASFWDVAEVVIVMDSLSIEKRGLGLGILWTLPDVVGFFSPYIGGLVFERYGVFGMRVALLLIAIADLAKAMLYMIFLKETLKAPVESKRVAFSIKGLKRLIVNSLTETLRTLKWMHRPLLALCVLNIIGSFTWLLTDPFFIFYATDVILLSNIEWGAIFSIMTLISLGLRFPGGRLVDRFGKRRTIIVNYAIDTLAILGFIHSRSYLQVLSLFVLRTTVTTLTWTAWQALQADLTPRDKRGKVFSLFRILGAFSGFLGAILGGYVYTLSPALPFWIYFILGIVGTALAFLIIKEAEKPEE